MPSRGRWLTRANGLTLLRLLAAPALALAILAERRWLAGALFLLAVATDLADGPVARRYGEASGLGALADHAVDAAFVALASAALARRGLLPPALAPLIALAFVQYAIDSRAPLARGLRASRLGRWNGIAYYVAVGTAVLRDALGLAWPPTSLLRALGWALALSTLVSMADRLRRLARARRSPGSPA
jgi:CDP-diacylglycerol--glycerol-3-phosphate 3-phosphatidyltransferase